MKHSQLPIIIVVALFALLLIGGSIIAVQQSLNNGNKNHDYNINSSQAQKIVLNDTRAAIYYTTYFHVKDWRVNRTTIVSGKIPDMHGALITPEEDIWKVEVMERTCACAGIKPIHVIEGYVSTNTGEVFNISTKNVLENSYDNSTCASTACH